MLESSYTICTKYYLDTWWGGYEDNVEQSSLLMWTVCLENQYFKFISFCKPTMNISCGVDHKTFGGAPNKKSHLLEKGCYC